MLRKMDRTKYPRTCEVLVNAREPTERERWIDLRSGAENPTTPTKLCGAELLSADDDNRHVASAHPDIWRLLEVLADIALDRTRSEG